MKQKILYHNVTRKTNICKDLKSSKLMLPLYLLIKNVCTHACIKCPISESVLLLSSRDSASPSVKTHGNKISRTNSSSKPQGL